VENLNFVENFQKCEKLEVLSEKRNCSKYCVENLMLVPQVFNQQSSQTIMTKVSKFFHIFHSLYY